MREARARAPRGAQLQRGAVLIGAAPIPTPPGCGARADTPRERIVATILDCGRRTAAMGLGPRAVAFEFVQARSRRGGTAGGRARDRRRTPRGHEARGLALTACPPGPVAAAQVGRDRDAQEFLARLDAHPQVGRLVDCTSYFELEQAGARAPVCACAQRRAHPGGEARASGPRARRLTGHCPAPARAPEYARRGVALSPAMWLVKMMVGAVDGSYDEGDE